MSNPEPWPYQGAGNRPNDEILDRRQLFSSPEPLLRSAGTDAQWPVTVVLLSGSIGDYAAYVGIGSVEWVASHGAKLSFNEALGFFPRITAQRYRSE